MNGIRTIAFSLANLVLFAAQSMELQAQTAATPGEGPSISVSLALAKDNVSLGESPQAVVTMRNIGKGAKCFRTADSLYRIHVEGKNGEPPETEMQRKRHAAVGQVNGADSGADSARCLYIAPGDWVHITYDLAMFYDFREPGRYTVSLELLDESEDRLGTGVWLKTNTAQLEVQAPAPTPGQPQAPAQPLAPAK